MAKKKKTTSIIDDVKIGSLNDLLCPTVLEFHENGFRLGEAECFIQSVYEYPSEVQPGWLQVLTQLPSSIVSIHCREASTKAILDAVQETINQGNSVIYANSSTEIQMQEAQDQINRAMELSQQLQANNAKAESVTINIMSYAYTKEDLEKVKEQVSGKMAGKNFNPRPLNLLQKEALVSMLPICRNNFRLMTGLDMTTQVFGGGLGWYTKQGLNDITGMYLGRDTSTNTPCFLDIWKRGDGRTNSNVLLTGVTGSGKSTTAKSILFNALAKGDKVAILDAEKEYLDMCEAMSGNIINASGGEGSRVNPLQLRDIPEAFDDMTDAQQAELAKRPDFQGSLSLHIPFLRKWFKMYIPDLNQIETAVLETALYEVYRRKGITEASDPRKMRNDEFPIMSDVYDVLNEALETGVIGNRPSEDKGVLKSLIAYLDPLVFGSDRFMFNGYTTVNLDRQFNVFNVNKLLDAPANTKNAQFYNLVSYLWLWMSSDRHERTILMVDEGHLFISAESTVTFEFLATAMRRVRKYEAAIILSTQQIADFLNRGAAFDTAQLEVMLTSTGINCFMRSKATDINYLNHLFGTSAVEEQFVQRADRGECLLLAGNSRSTIKVEVEKNVLKLISKSGGN